MKSRLHSLDVFRGATIAAMILVNNAGDWNHVYPQLRHADWHGWTFTDVIFPFFLWIVGVAMTLSFARRVERGDSRGRLLAHTARRAAIIFALGLFLNLFPAFDFANIRIPGVLQRIAVCYFIAAILLLRTAWQGQAATIAVLCAAYWAVMTLVPVPGYGAGVLEKERNFAHWIDRLVLEGHMWQATKTWDPEGIVSTLPAIATTLFGVLAGHLLRARIAAADKAAWLFAGGNALMFASFILTIWMPYNKALWTVPYAVLMAGLAANVFAFCYWVADVQGWRRWTGPFTAFGMNAIAVYVFAGMLADLVPGLRDWAVRNVFAGAGLENASLLWALAFVLVTYLFAWALYRKGWFIKV